MVCSVQLSTITVSQSRYNGALMDYTLHLNPADILDGIGYNPNHSAHEEGTQTTTYSEALTGGIVVTRTSLLTGEDNTQFVEGITEEDLSNYDRHSITIGGISEDDKQFIDTGITMAELVDAFNDIEGTQGVNHGR